MRECAVMLLLILALTWTMVFCNTNECDADRGFFTGKSDTDNRMHSLVTIVLLCIHKFSYLYYYRRAVRIYLSSKFDEFLARRSQFDSDHAVDIYAHLWIAFAFYCPLAEICE